MNKAGIIILCCAAIAARAGELLQNIVPVKQQEQTVVIRPHANLRQVTIPRLNAPDLNGGHAGWENAYRNDKFTIIHERAETKAKGRQAAGEWEIYMPETLKPSQPTEIYLGYDDRYLYLKAICHENMMERISMVDYQERDDAVYGNDSIDIVLAANRNDIKHYQLVVNGFGSRLDTVNQLINGKLRTDASWNPEYKVYPVLGKDSWQVTMAIPFAELGLTAKDGSFFDLNICRNEIPYRELSSWGPVQRTFHEKDRMVRAWLGHTGTAAATLDTIEYLPPKIGRNDLKVKVTNQSGKPFAGQLELKIKGPEGAAGSTRPAAAETTMDMTFAKPGKYTVETVLTAGEQVIDSSAFLADLAPPLLVTLSSHEIFASTTSVSGTLKTNIANLKDYDAIFTLGKQTFTLPLESDRYTFALDTGEITGKSQLTVELRKRGTGEITAKVSLELNKNSDPFDE